MNRKCLHSILCFLCFLISNSGFSQQTENIQGTFNTLDGKGQLDKARLTALSRHKWNPWILSDYPLP